MRNLAISILFAFLYLAQAGAQDFSALEPYSDGQIVMEVNWQEAGGEIYYRLGDCEVRKPIVFWPGQEVWVTFSSEVVTIADPADLENRVLCPFAILMGESVYYLTVDGEGLYRYCEERYLKELPYQN